jgi:hypothetical protein
MIASRYSYTALRHAPGARGAPRLIGEVRDLLRSAGVPYCIENVEEAACDMINPSRLPLAPSQGVPRRSRCEKRHSATVNELSRLRHQAVAEPRADLHKPNRPPTTTLVWPGQGRRSTALP